MAESQSRHREKQERAEEGDVSCRSLLERDQAVAFWYGAGVARVDCTG
jgi:hypothetical protein